MKLTARQKAFRTLLLAASSTGIHAVPATAQHSDSIHLPAYDPGRTAPVAVLGGIALPRSTNQAQTVAAAHATRTNAAYSQTSTPKITTNQWMSGQVATPAEAWPAPVAAERIAFVNFAELPQEKQAGRDRAVETKPNEAAELRRNRVPPAGSDVGGDEAAARQYAERAREMQERMRFRGLAAPGAQPFPPPPPTERDVEALERVLESAVIQHILELTEKRIEQKAESRIREAELRIREVEMNAEMRVMELELNHGRQELGRREEQLQIREQELNMRQRELEQEAQQLGGRQAELERNFDQRNAAIEAMERHTVELEAELNRYRIDAEQELQRFKRNEQQLEEKLESVALEMNRKMESVLKEKAELEHRARAMESSLKASETEVLELKDASAKMSKALEEAEKAATEKLDAKQEAGKRKKKED